MIANYDTNIFSQKASKEIDYVKAHIKSLLPRERQTLEAVLEIGQMLKKRKYISTTAADVAKVIDTIYKGYPLSAIEDEDDIWVKSKLRDGIEEKDIEYCWRYPFLTKDSSGHVSDYNRVVFRNDDGSSWKLGCVTKVFDGLYPIRFPYEPSNDKIYVYGHIVPNEDILNNPEQKIVKNVKITQITIGRKTTEVDWEIKQNCCDGPIKLIKYNKDSDNELLKF